MKYTVTITLQKIKKEKSCLILFFIFTVADLIHFTIKFSVFDNHFSRLYNEIKRWSITFMGKMSLSWQRKRLFVLSYVMVLLV